MFSGPRTPTDNAFIESLNGNFRDEHLNCHRCKLWFLLIIEQLDSFSEWPYLS
ncbi:TPA: transposase [Escherichia coli]|uniref:integrase core domain-containing protein n=1 Tax=Escherichia coli TaxID=562 RepID=UPI0013B05DE5|nr:transposase [Escherichia coli]EHW2479819.1 transposase [Escherichia coli]EKA2397124.1 transposase [Escherichia coli]HAL9871450.1 transposase [Escherichia coli]HCO0445649.1 transposase [Escherichia coli]